MLSCLLVVGLNHSSSFSPVAEEAAKHAEDMERQRLEEMDEEEYDALPDEEKARVDEKRLVIKKQRIKK
jgi:hypothetical protein